MSDVELYLLIKGNRLTKQTFNQKVDRLKTVSYGTDYAKDR